MNMEEKKSGNLQYEQSDLQQQKLKEVEKLMMEELRKRSNQGGYDKLPGSNVHC